MVTVLDVGLIKAFDIIFPVLLVWAVIFALLQKTKILTQSTGINGLIAAVFGLMVVLSQEVVDIINFMIPWFGVAIIFFVIILLIFMVFGAKESDIFDYMKGNMVVGWVLLGLIVAILIAAIGSSVGQTVGPFLGGEGNSDSTATGGSSVASANFDQNFWATVFHPKVLGLLVLFGISVFAVLLLSNNQ
jgi:hypothetical protein